LAFRVPGVVATHRADVTWLERELHGGCPTLEFLVRRPYAFDVDDAVWLEKPFGRAAARSIARRAAVVIAGNEYLAAWFSAHCRDVRIVPTAIDVGRFFPATPNPDQRRRFVVGWTGSSSNYPYLYEIEDPLAAFLVRRDSELRIVADVPPQFRKIGAEHISFIPWSLDVEASALRSMDVGIMPLPDDEWTRGKCSFKMLQYMATGLPVVVSPVGMNAELLGLGAIGFAARNPQEWAAALDRLWGDWQVRKELGGEGRRVAEARFSVEVVSMQLASIFRELAASKGGGRE
jgi:glycosyltransferase involved in cell wall biosynthesis